MDAAKQVRLEDQEQVVGALGDQQSRTFAGAARVLCLQTDGQTDERVKDAPSTLPSLSRNERGARESERGRDSEEDFGQVDRKRET